MITGIIKSIGVAEIRKQGKKLRDKDDNTTGTDDAGGRSLEAMAEALDVMDFSNVQSAKSLFNIGAGLIAAGHKLQEESLKLKAEGK